MFDRQRCNVMLLGWSLLTNPTSHVRIKAKENFVHLFSIVTSGGMTGELVHPRIRCASQCRRVFGAEAKDMCNAVVGATRVQSVVLGDAVVFH